MEVRRLTSNFHRRHFQSWNSEPDCPIVFNYLNYSWFAIHMMQKVHRYRKTTGGHLVLEGFFLDFFDPNTPASSAGSPCALSFLQDKVQRVLFACFNRLQWISSKAELICASAWMLRLSTIDPSQSLHHSSCTRLSSMVLNQKSLIWAHGTCICMILYFGMNVTVIEFNHIQSYNRVRELYV